MRKVSGVRKLTDNQFLNLYEMDAPANDGAPFHYYFASRNREDELPAGLIDRGRECSSGGSEGDEGRDRTQG